MDASGVGANHRQRPDSRSDSSGQVCLHPPRRISRAHRPRVRPAGPKIDRAYRGRGLCPDLERRRNRRHLPQQRFLPPLSHRGRLKRHCAELVYNCAAFAARRTVAHRRIIWAMAAFADIKMRCLRHPRPSSPPASGSTSIPKFCAISNHLNVGGFPRKRSRAVFKSSLSRVRYISDNSSTDLPVSSGASASREPTKCWRISPTSSGNST